MSKSNRSASNDYAYYLHCQENARQMQAERERRRLTRTTSSYSLVEKVLFAFVIILFLPVIANGFVL